MPLTIAWAGAIARFGALRGLAKRRSLYSQDAWLTRQVPPERWLPDGSGLGVGWGQSAIAQVWRGNSTLPGN